MKRKPIVLAVLALMLPLAGAKAQPAVPGATTSIYTTVDDPRDLSFGADGALYAGRDNSGSGGGPADAVKIHRVGPGGSPVTEFGSVAIADPDTVIVDQTGVISGIAGAVLAGGQTSPGVGQVARVAPDGTVTALFGPSSLYSNPSGFAFDSLGRLLFTEAAGGRVYRADGGTPVLLFNLTDAWAIACDATDRIVVSLASTPRLLLYSASGIVSNANFAAVKAGSPVARGPGGMWTTDIYAITDAGDLVRIALDGTTNTMGSGFGNIEGMTFGPDGALYVSDFPGDSVWRIAAAQTIVSTFDTDADGWGLEIIDSTFSGNPPRVLSSGAPAFYSSEGNPGGYIGSSDPDGFSEPHFVAPAKFLGNKSEYYGGVLNFDVKCNFELFGNLDQVELRGNGHTLFYGNYNSNVSCPANTWTNWSIPLAPAAGWRLDDYLSGGIPTEADFVLVLSNLQELNISGDLGTGTDTSGLDNVRMSPAQTGWTTNNLPSGLISWWNADTNTLDVTGLNPAVSSGQTYAPGRFGQAFHFDGVSQSVTAPGSASLDQWPQFTLEAWMKLDQTADPNDDAPGRAVINRVGRANDQVNYNQGYQFGFWNNARNLFLAFNVNGQAWPGYYTQAFLPAPMPTNVWLHYVATYDHNAVKLYLNGVPLITNVIGAATVAHSTSSFRIGMDDNGNCPFPGSIDDVRVYNRALTPAEIAGLFAGPNPPVNKPTLKNTPQGDGNLTFEWDSISNQTYHVESATNLANPNWQRVGWQPVGDLIIATNAATSVSYPVGAEIQRFYRVVTP